MAITPDNAEPELLGQDAGVGPPPTFSLPGSDVLESEVQEHEREARERTYLDLEANELHVAGEVCERCGAAITASQDARRLVDGRFVHEVCPYNK
jgi:hypothetical protein